MTIINNTKTIKSIASELGFDFCGISKAAYLEEEVTKFEEWLKRGYQGKMGYLDRNFDKRLDPTKLVEGAKSVVSLVYNYFPSKIYEEKGSLKIAKYAYGQDYHFVIKHKLKDFMSRIREKIGDVDGRVFVDSAPVHERAWASKSGLGWIGKNSLLINRQMGSFFFLAELIIDLELEADGPIADYCGTCTKCIDACPTDAIAAPHVVDGSKCISYLTIELKDEIPYTFKNKMEDWVFGCDICQDVCPWNRFSKPTNETFFEPQGWEGLHRRDWEEMTLEVFQKVFKKSPLKRAKYLGLRKNIDFIKK